MDFATSRFYPVSESRKIVFLDSQPRKMDCSRTPFRGCVGMSGQELNDRWEELTKAGYQTQRRFPDKRGGAGRGQGRKPLPDPVTTIKVKLAYTQYQRLKTYVANLCTQSGRSISNQSVLSEFVLKANLNQVAPFVKDESGDRSQSTITEQASARLEMLTKGLAKVLKHQDVKVSKITVLSAIVAQALEGKE